jgi:hypothetical protein
LVNGIFGISGYLILKQKIRILVSYFLPESIKGSVYAYSLMRETKYSLGLPLAIAIGVMIATSASVGSVLAAGNMTAAGGAAGNATKAGNMTAAGGAAGNATKSTSSNSSNPLAKIGQALSGLFGGKK